MENGYPFSGFCSYLVERLINIFSYLQVRKISSDRHGSNPSLQSSGGSDSAPIRIYVSSGSSTASSSPIVEILPMYHGETSTRLIEPATSLKRDKVSGKTSGTPSPGFKSKDGVYHSGTR